MEVGKLGLPEGVINDKSQIVGKIARTDIFKEDYFSKKLGEYLADEKLDHIAKQSAPYTISVPTSLQGFLHFQSGDIVIVACL